jgi:hypothetical protein
MLPHVGLLLAYAKKRCGKLDDPLAFVHQAILRASDPEDERCYRPDEHPKLRIYLLRLLRDLIRQERERKRREVPYDDEKLAELLVDTGPTGQSPLARFIAFEEGYRLMADLKARVKDRPLDLSLIDWSQEGVFDPEEQAERAGVTPGEIDLARRRLRYHLEAIYEARKKKGEDE